MGIRVDRKVLEAMNKRFKNKVPFPDALDTAIHTILNDESDRNSPRAVMMDVLEVYPDQYADYTVFDQIIRPELKKRMNEGYLMLLPVWEEIPEDKRDFQTPDNREASERHWNFFLGITTDDHQFWTIVDRLGKKNAYNYGLN